MVVKGVKTMQNEVQTVEHVGAAGARLFVETAQQSVEARGRFCAALSGGSTPLEVYKILVNDYRDAPFWTRTQLFWGDERFVPHDHEDSNYGAARENLIRHVPIPDGQVHPWPYLADEPERSAHSYAAIVSEVLGEPPQFDLSFLGLGDDGHTASLFPGTGAVHEEGLTAVVRPEGKGTRLSFTAPLLNQSRTVAFLVQGEKKREALEETLRGEKDLEHYPAQAIEARRLLCLPDLDV